MKNYKKIEEKFISEIDSNVIVYEHIKTKAKILTMSNDDDNKVFSIAFRTPAINSCGLTHILEHSVLCGSKNYPVKDPFVELLKGSLNTFLNAFTFADKTMYPIASKNLKDFRNLAHVYLDAVFYPGIYNHEEIFMQEGWHYHILDENDPITYNGVVYNEMKGAFSDPQQVLQREILNSLFPDTSYGFESGGDPKYIPDLTYEVFKDFHSKYYSPSNSYIMLYGNMDMESELEWIDKDYLNDFDYVEFDTKIKDQIPFEKPRRIELSYETTGDLENKAFLAYNVSLPVNPDYKMVIATHILLTSLFDVTGAPLHEALIDAEIASDVSSYIDDEVKTPYLSIVCEGANASDIDKFINVIDTELKKILKDGLDKKTIESIINHTEYENREKNFSSRMPKGLGIQIDAMASWLYDNDPTDKIEIIKYYDELKNELNTDYFENIVKDIILNNNHKTYIVLKPTLDANKEEDKRVEEKLKCYKESLSKDELKALIEKNKRLEEYQSTPDTKDAIDTLPKLTLDDIDPNPDDFKLEVIDKKYKVLYSEYNTNDIIYLKYYFDITDIDYRKLQYIALYTDLFRDLNTKSMSYFDLNQGIRNDLGTLSSNLTHYDTIDRTSHTSLSINSSSLLRNADLILKYLIPAVFDVKIEKKKLKEKITEFKTSMAQNVSGKGHQVALTRALGFINRTNFNRDNTTGIGYLDFINDLYDNFDERYDEIKENLLSVPKLLSKKNFTLGVTGDRSILDKAILITDKFYEMLNDDLDYPRVEFKPNPHKEAIKTPFNVNFVALGGHTTKEFDASSMVLQNTMSMDFLWDRIRVHGGAYGAMMSYSTNGTMGYTTYRDPNIDRTYNIYKEAPDFIKNLNINDDDLLKYKIGAIGNSQLVLHPKEMGESARGAYFMKNTFEFRKKNRLRIINTTNDDLIRFSDVFKDAVKDDSVCVIGSSKQIDESTIKFDVIRDLVK